MRVLVIGAGIIGLSTAYYILGDVAGAEVMIVADSFSPNTVSGVSQGLWKPHRNDKTPVHLQQ